MCSGFRESVDLLVLGDHMLFTWRLSVQMSRCGFRSEDILREKALFYKLLQVLLEGPAVDGLMSLTFVVGTIFSDPGSEGLC